MRDLRPLNRRTLTWKQPKFSVDHFELRSEDDLLGEINWTKWFSDEAVARCDRGVWIFDRIGFFRDQVIAKDAGSRMEVARFAFEWTKDGRLTLPDGRNFRWHRTKAFADAWALADESETPVFELEFGMSWFKQKAVVSLGARAEATPGLGLLLCVGFYLGYCTIQDIAASVVATSAAVCG